VDETVGKREGIWGQKGKSIRRGKGDLVRLERWWSKGFLWGWSVRGRKKW